MPPSSTRQLSTITRIYRNSATEILAVDCLSIHVNKEQASFGRFIKYITSVDKKRTLMHLTIGGDRVVSEIQMIGDYSSIEENSGNFFVATWLPATASENTLQISLERYVSVLGDTL